jgi:hypothetical protein
MHTSSLSQWRTVFTTIALAAGMGVILFFSKPQGELFAKSFADLTWSYVMMVTLVAGKSAVQHVSGAGGLKNLVVGLLGEKKVPADAPVVAGVSQDKP